MNSALIISNICEDTMAKAVKAPKKAVKKAAPKKKVAAKKTVKKANTP
jgi:hypothetical protein